jgi:hypothetical protein
MTTIIKDLIFDKELVSNMKDSNLNKGLLYNQLISGRITMQEYLRLA